MPMLEPQGVVWGFLGVRGSPCVQWGSLGSYRYVGSQFCSVGSLGFVWTFWDPLGGTNGG